MPGVFVARAKRRVCALVRPVHRKSHAAMLNREEAIADRQAIVDVIGRYRHELLVPPRVVTGAGGRWR